MDLNIDNFGLGIYIVIVWDVNNCVVILDVVVVEFSLISLFSGMMEVECFGECSGGVFINVIGGLFFYIYFWLNGGMDFLIIGVVVGVYMVFIIDVVNCI